MYTVGTRSVVDGGALVADLALVPSKHVDLAELAHGVRELALEHLGLPGHLLDEPRRPGVLEHPLVRLQEPHPALQVLVVPVVERRRRLAVQLHALRIVSAVALAEQEVAVLPVQRLRLAGQHPPLHRPAARLPDRVRPGEDDEVEDVEAPGLEELDEVGDSLAAHGNLRVGLLGVGVAAVLPAVLERPVGHAHLHAGVAGGGREDVGAGHGVVAARVELGLDLLDQLEAPERLARRRVPLAARRVDQDRPVAPSDGEVVEE